MATNETTTLSTSEVRALAHRLMARAQSTLMQGTPNQQSDGLLAAATILHLMIELQELRSTVDRIAAGMPPDSAATQALFDALTPQGPASQRAGCRQVRHAMKKKRKAATPIRSDIMAVEGGRLREHCFDAVEQIEAALRVVKKLDCNLDARTVSILQLAGAALSEINERR